MEIVYGLSSEFFKGVLFSDWELGIVCVLWKYFLGARMSEIYAVN